MSEGLQEQIQSLCENYLGRKFNATDVKIMRKFLSDLQRQNLEEEVEKDTKPEIVTVSHNRLVFFASHKPWEQRKEEIKQVPLSESPVVPVIRADSRLYNRVESWAYIAAEKNKAPEVKNDAPVQVSAVGASAGLAQRMEKYNQEITGSTSPRSGNRPADLPDAQQVGIKDRLGKWKAAEEGKTESAPAEKKEGKPADLEVDVGISSRLGVWKSAEEGKGPADAKPIQKTVSDLPVQVGIEDRLGKWKSAEEGKGPADAKPVQKTVADLPVEVDIGNRLGKWKSAEEGKTEEAPVSARKAPIEIKVADKDGNVEVVHAPQVKDRLNTYVKVTEEPKPVAAVKATEEVQSAPKLRDRLTSYSKAAEDKPVEKAAVVVPYDDNYEAPAFNPEADSKPYLSTVVSSAFRKPSEEVAEAPKLKDRLKALENAAQDKPLEKAPVVVPYDDDYEQPVIGGEEQSAPAVRREPVKIEGASSLKDRLNNWNEAAAEKPAPKTVIDIPDPEDD